MSNIRLEASATVLEEQAGSVYAMAFNQKCSDLSTYSTDLVEYVKQNITDYTYKTPDDTGADTTGVFTLGNWGIHTYTLTADGADHYIFTSDAYTGYDPALTVHVGDIVSITNSTGGHPFRIAAGTSASGSDFVYGDDSLTTGNTRTYRFDTAGTYTYYCTTHSANMKGTITVSSATNTIVTHTGNITSYLNNDPDQMATATADPTEFGTSEATYYIYMMMRNHFNNLDTMVYAGTGVLPDNVAGGSSGGAAASYRYWGIRMRTTTWRSHSLGTSGVSPYWSDYQFFKSKSQFWPQDRTAYTEIGIGSGNYHGVSNFINNGPTKGYINSFYDNEDIKIDSATGGVLGLDDWGGHTYNQGYSGRFGAVGSNASLTYLGTKTGGTNLYHIRGNWNNKRSGVNCGMGGFSMTDAGSTRINHTTFAYWDASAQTNGKKAKAYGICEVGFGGDFFGSDGLRHGDIIFVDAGEPVTCEQIVLHSHQNGAHPVQTDDDVGYDIIGANDLLNVNDDSQPTNYWVNGDTDVEVPGTSTNSPAWTMVAENVAAQGAVSNFNNASEDFQLVLETDGSGTWTHRWFTDKRAGEPDPGT